MKLLIKPLILLLNFCVILFLCSCVGGGGQSSAITQEGQPAERETVAGTERIELGSIDEMPKVVQVAVGYKTLVIEDLVSSQQVKTDYPKAAADCKTSVLKQLSEKKNYLSVTGDKITVSLEILDMRITSSTARMFGGAFVGSSFMDVLIKITDSKSGEVIHEKELSTSNNAWAASYSGGSSDQSLPSDFGMLIGEYIYAVVPAK